MRIWAPGTDDPSGPTLVVTAHPDDVDFSMAGTVAALGDAGIRVVYCVVTDGDAGGSDRSVSRTEMAALRREEQLKAAAEVGVDEVHFLGYPDGRLVASLDLRRDLARVIRTVRPGRVLCQSPERLWESVYASHPDHMAAGEAALAAAYPDARNPFAFPELLEEGLEPHVVPEIWVAATPRPDLAVDTTVFLERKLAALRSHRSQVGDGEHLRERIVPWNRSQAEAAGLPGGSLAELYRVVDAR